MDDENTTLSHGMPFKFDRYLKAFRKLRKHGACANCKAPPPKRKMFRKCAACKVTPYCSKECQKANWDAHRCVNIPSREMLGR